MKAFIAAALFLPMAAMAQADGTQCCSQQWANQQAVQDRQREQQWEAQFRQQQMLELQRQQELREERDNIGRLYEPY